MSYLPRAEAFRVIRDKAPISTKGVAEELGVGVQGLSYHIRKLKDLGCIEEVGSRRVKNAVETFYRPTEQHMVLTEEWDELAELDPNAAELLVDDFMQSIVDDYTASRKARIVGLDKEFFITRTPLLLDPEGVEEALEASEEYEKQMLDIATRSANRRGENGTEEIHISSSVAFFKMPSSSEE